MFSDNYALLTNIGRNHVEKRFLAIVNARGKSHFLGYLKLADEEGIKELKIF